MLVARFIAADGANRVREASELRRLEGTGALVNQVVSAHSAGGRPGELGRLVEQAWHAQVDSVIFLLTSLDDRRGSVTKSTLCTRAPGGEGSK